MGQCSGAEVRGICTEAGMYALLERRQHAIQEDFKFAVAKVWLFLFLDSETTLTVQVGVEEEPRRQYFG